MSGGVEEVAVSNGDRLCRFGFNLSLAVARKYDTRIVVLDEAQFSPQRELVRDLISVLRVFSRRIHGLRKYSREI